MDGPLLQQEEINHFFTSLSEFKLTDDGDLSAADKSLIYYIAGYIAKACISDCESCNDVVSPGKVSLDVNIESTTGENEDESCLQAKEAFIEAVSRGGLTRPSDYLYISAVHAAALYTHVFKDEQLRTALLATVNPRTTFIECYIKSIGNDEFSAPLLQIKCTEGHCHNKHIRRTAFTVFNISSKNYASNLNDDLRNTNAIKRAEKRSQAARKIKKLKGQ